MAQGGVAKYKDSVNPTGVQYVSICNHPSNRRGYRDPMAMDDDIFARKVITLLKQGDTNLSRHIVERLGNGRRMALAAHRPGTRTPLGVHQPARVITASRGAVGMGLLISIAAVWAALSQGNILDAAVHPEIVPIRAYSDSGFNQWSVPEGSEDD